VRSGDGGIFQTLTATASADGRHANGFVQIAMNLGDEERLLSLYRERMALVLGLALIATALVGYLIARGGMQPIQRIGTAAARIGSSTLHERIETRDLPAELGGLAEAFNTMLDRLENAFARVSRFSDDAAHELRTPINNLRGEIEVALSRPRSKEDYQQVLGSSLEECSRISRIIEGLLFLARTEAATDELRREEVDVGEALEAVREFYEAAASDKGAALAVIFAPDLRARLDRTLFQQAVGNLVSNAIAHTPPGGTIALEARRGEDALLVVVADTGCGIAEQHLPHVFDRFYRVDRARSGGEHVGLGLAVVRSIVERHGGCAEIDSTLGGGARVQLIFPD
jgi:two-component system heavy metal sensor histidine kinase CusS